MKKILSVFSLICAIFVLSSCSFVEDFINPLMDMSSSPDSVTETEEDTETADNDETSDDDSDETTSKEPKETETEKETEKEQEQEYDLSEDKLMNARSLVRMSNISIDTVYQSQGTFYSRTQGKSLGSGVVFYEDATYYYALTNNHVITEYYEGKKYTTQYTITDINGYTYNGSVVIADENRDIAIIKFKKTSESKLRLINIENRLNDNVVEDEFVLAVGNPSGVKNIVTYGEIYGYTNIKNVEYKVIYHNAIINPGNSGGALCDLEGNLLGINTWGEEGKDDSNFAIPLSVVNNFVEKFYDEIGIKSEKEVVK